jgi:hypothetical protein
MGIVEGLVGRIIVLDSVFTVFSPAHQNTLLEPGLKFVSLSMIMDIDVTAKGMDVLMVDFTAKPNSVWDTPFSCIRNPVAHMNTIRSGFCPERERQGGVGENSTDSIQDGPMSTLNSAVLRVSIRRNLVCQCAVLCKQVLECLRGELGSTVCTDPIHNGLAMVLDLCNILIELLQGFQLGLHTVEPDMFSVIIIAGQEVFTVTMRSCTCRTPDVNMNQFIWHDGPFHDNMGRQPVTLPLMQSSHCA